MGSFKSVIFRIKLNKWIKTMKSIWRVAHNFPLYEISIFGDVRRISTQRVLKPWYNKHLNNYATVRLRKKVGGDTRNISLARLMLHTFQYSLKRKKYALHYDMDHTNNTNDNLAWSTRGDLMRYKRSGKVKGVYKWSIGKNKFRAVLKIGKKVRTLGYYRTFEQAQHVHYEAFLKTFGYEPYSMVRV